MSRRRRRLSSDYEIGYGKPPVHSRFQKGRSGNPRGRPKGNAGARLAQILDEEAFRLVTVRDGERTIRIPAIQGVLRSLLAQAAKGNGPAGRALIAALQTSQHTTQTAKPDLALEPYSPDRAALAILKVLRGDPM